ncbi:unnamed protein product, partial [marine sediment metagenome]
MFLMLSIASALVGIVFSEPFRDTSDGSLQTNNIPNVPLRPQISEQLPVVQAPPLQQVPVQQPIPQSVEPPQGIPPNVVPQPIQQPVQQEPIPSTPDLPG